MTDCTDDGSGDERRPEMSPFSMSSPAPFRTATTLRRAPIVSLSDPKHKQPWGGFVHSAVPSAHDGPGPGLGPMRMMIDRLVAQDEAEDGGAVRGSALVYGNVSAHALPFARRLRSSRDERMT